MNNIIVDADSCPVKQEILDVASVYNKEVTFVSSYAHTLSKAIGGTWITVDSNKEEADLYIANHVAKGDVVVTQDYGLAALVINRGVHVLTPRGKEIHKENIDVILFERFLSSKSRRAGLKTKGPKAFTEEDRLNFVEKLKEIVEI